MTKKEKIQKLKMSLYNRNVDMRIIMAQQDIICDIEKDLENLEKYEKIFDTPLIEIRKQLGILGILKKIIKIDYNTKFTYGNKKYLISLRQDVIVNDETLKIIKEWLEDDQTSPKD